MMKAFPGTPTFDQDANRTVWQEGMDLRDYFAASALPAILDNEYPLKSAYDIAEKSYIIADKMMEVRNGSKK